MKAFNKFGIAGLLGVFLFITAAKDDKKETERVEKATEVLQDFAKMKESIPASLLDQSKGIVIIPNMINAGLGIGGKRGKGVAMVKLANGQWSNPVFITITGGSIGFQAGVQSVDLVLLFKHKNALTDTKKGDFTIGGDLSAAAGPIGRSASANTDYKLDAEVYSYSRSKGLFAGLSLNGSNLSFDKDANTRFYGKMSDTQTIFAHATSESSAVVALHKSIVSMQ
ncbi:Lipid-binding SYLF domain-containing protein [bacterium A37T11]|nr:Lipid-binding SYLF domain-containing protein [bacterium A37T11]